MAASETQARVMCGVATSMATREQRPYAVERRPAGWTVRPAADPTPPGWERVETVEPGQENDVGVMKRIRGYVDCGTKLTRDMERFANPHKVIEDPKPVPRGGPNAPRGKGQATAAAMAMFAKEAEPLPAPESPPIVQDAASCVPEPPPVCLPDPTPPAPKGPAKQAFLFGD